jgi:hypothetical protein
MHVKAWARTPLLADLQDQGEGINVAQIEAGRDRWQALNALQDYDIPTNLERL